MKIIKKDFRGGISSKVDENILGLSKAKNVSNYEFLSGALKSMCPFSAQNLPFLTGDGSGDSFPAPDFSARKGGIFYFKKFDFSSKKPADKLIVFDANYNMYYLNLYDENKVFVPLGITFNSQPVLVNYRLNSEDVLVMCSAGDNMMVWNGVDKPEIILDAPLVSSICVHNERLFVTGYEDNYEVAFSDDLDITNWTVGLDGAGFISMPGDAGKVLKVISFLGYVYIFREKGISRLVASGGQEDFYLSDLFVSGGKIFANTITVCGDKIIFVASDGIYAFDGVSTHKILTDIEKIVSVDDYSRAVFFDGKYFLTIKVGENKKENSVLIYLPDSGEYGLYSMGEVIDMAPVVADGYNNLYFLVKNENSPIFVYDINSIREFSASFVSGLYDFDDASDFKTVRRLSLYAEVKDDALVDFLFYNEKGEEVLVPIENGQKDYPVFFSGKSIGFKIVAKNCAVIKNVSLYIK